MGDMFSTEWLQCRLSGDVAAYMYFFEQVGHELSELVVEKTGKTTKVTSKGMVHIVCQPTRALLMEVGQWPAILQAKGISVCAFVKIKHEEIQGTSQ